MFGKQLGQSGDSDHQVPGFHDGDIKLPGKADGMVGYFQTTMGKLV